MIIFFMTLTIIDDLNRIGRGFVGKCIRVCGGRGSNPRPCIYYVLF